MSNRIVFSAFLLSVVAGFLVICFGGCSKEVQVGEITVCKHCGKEVSNTVRTISVRRWKAQNYGVERSETYCEDCGDELISCNFVVRCIRCKTAYKSWKEHAPRKTEPQDKVVDEGYCSARCERAARIEDTIDKVSETTGDVIGRIGKGVSDGIQKHIK